MFTVSAFLSSEVRELPPSAILLGLLRPIVGIPIVVALLLALQRLGPTPSVVAPALASLWWLLSFVSHFVLGVPPEPDAVRALKFDDAPSLPSWVSGIILHAVLLWFVVSTWLHGATQAYLTRERRLKG